MSQSEDHWYLEEVYPDFFGYALREDFLEAQEIHRDLESLMEDEPSEYEIDRALEALRKFNGNVEIVEVDGGNIYDVSDYTLDDHEQISEEWIEQETST